MCRLEERAGDEPSGQALFVLGDVVEVILEVDAGEEESEGGTEIEADGFLLVVVVDEFAAEDENDGDGEDEGGGNEASDEPSEGG